MQNNNKTYFLNVKYNSLTNCFILINKIATYKSVNTIIIVYFG